MEMMTQVFGALCLLISINVGLQTWRLVLNLWDPFFYKSVVAITPIVKPNECFIEELDVQRYRICKVDIDRFAVEEATGNVVFRERVPGGATAIGTNVARNMVCPVKPWPVGKIKLLQNVHSECIDGMHSMQWPVMRFEVVE